MCGKTLTHVIWHFDGYKTTLSHQAPLPPHSRKQCNIAYSTRKYCSIKYNIWQYNVAWSITCRNKASPIASSNVWKYSTLCGIKTRLVVTGVFEYALPTRFPHCLAHFRTFTCIFVFRLGSYVPQLTLSSTLFFFGTLGNVRWSTVTYLLSYAATRRISFFLTLLVMGY